MSYRTSENLLYDEVMDKKAIGVVRGVLGIAVSLLIALLGVRFLVACVEPGNPDNQSTFQAMGMLLTPLRMVTDLLGFPIRFLLVPLGAMLHIDSWFPMTPLGGILESISQGFVAIMPQLMKHLFDPLIAFDFEYWFPGKLDWTLLLAIPFWSFIEQQLERVLDGFDRQIDQGRRQDTDRKLTAHFSASTGDAPAPAAPSGTLPFASKRPPAPSVGLEGAATKVTHTRKPLERQVSSDTQTGLANRHAFDGALRREVDAGHAQGGVLGVILLEIDQLATATAVNPDWNEALIKRAAGIAEKQVPMRGQVVTYRTALGGLGLIVSRTTLEAVERVAQMVCYEIATAKFPENAELRMTASLGVFAAEFKAPEAAALDDREFISRAEMQLEEARQNGRNQLRMQAVR